MAAKTIAVVALILAACQLSLAVDHTVGGSNGWGFQGGYDQWAASNTFRVGDTLTFNYAGNHDVLEVSRADYDNCDASRPIQTYQLASPIQVTLSRSGEHWFLCGVTGHCTAGMRVPINVLDASTPSGTTPVTPRVDAATPTPQPHSAATSTVFSAGLAAAAVGSVTALLL